MIEFIQFMRERQGENGSDWERFRAFGWLDALGWGLGEEADGLGTFFGVVVEGDVE